MKKSILKLVGIICLSITGLITPSCEGTTEIEKVTFLEKRVLDAEDTVSRSAMVQGDAHSGKYFSRTSGANQYGMGTVFKITDSLVGKDLRVCVDFWVRTNNSQPQQSFAVALHDGDNVISWNEIMINKKQIPINQWVNVKDSITIPAYLISKAGLNVIAYPFNPKGIAVFDTDDITLIFKKLEITITE